MKNKQTHAVFALLVLGVGVCRAGVSLPSDFSTTQGSNGIFYEEIGDSRSTNVLNPAPAGTAQMAFQGNVAIAPFGPLPTYSDASQFPYVQLDSADGVLVMHPGTGGFNFGTGTANIGAAIDVQAATAGLYDITGGFARDNPSQNAGNGVDVLVIGGTDLDHPLFSATISSNHAVDTSNPFGGTGVANFNLQLPLAAGDSVRFVVFSDGQGQDGTFDATAFRATVALVPEPASWGLFATGTVGVLWRMSRRRRRSFPTAGERSRARAG